MEYSPTRRPAKVWVVIDGGTMLVWPGDRQEPYPVSTVVDGWRRSWTRRDWFAKSPSGLGRPMEARFGPCVSGLREVGIDLTKLPKRTPIRLNLTLAVVEKVSYKQIKGRAL